MTNTVMQWRNEKLISVFQWEDSKGTYHTIQSLIRFAKNRRGSCVGFFASPESGDILTWIQTEEYHIPSRPNSDVILRIVF